MSLSQRALNALRALTFAGSGVLVSTAFIHLLLPAAEALSSPCLPESFLTAYPSWAFLICTITLAAAFIGDFLIATAVARWDSDDGSLSTAEPHKHAVSVETPGDAPSGAVAGPCVVHRRCEDVECGGRPLLPTPAQARRLRAVAVLLAESSIAVHSVLIGLALGVAPASEIVPLLIALTFHQALEGVALGAAAVDAGISRRAYIALVAVFSMTTPLGAAVGVSVRSVMNPNGAAGLLVQGILDAVCAGVLIFLAFGDHINAFRAHAVWLRSQGNAWVTVACLGAFAAGVGVMVAIGIWA
jgi:zinc transporter 1/2/3